MSDFYELRDQAQKCWINAQELTDIAVHQLETGAIGKAEYYDKLTEATLVQQKAMQFESEATDAYLENMRLLAWKAEVEARERDHQDDLVSQRP